MVIDIPVDVAPKEVIKILEKQRPKLLDLDLFSTFPAASNAGEPEATAVEYSSWDGRKLDVNFSKAHKWGVVRENKS